MKKILIIEDESALQKTFSDLLGGEGYKVISALDGEVGLETAKKEKPDLILLDLILPKINGFGVLKRLKADDTTKNIPVIVLTNLEGVEDVNKAIELGIKTYLVKGQYSLEDIVTKIKDCIGTENP